MQPESITLHVVADNDDVVVSAVRTVFELEATGENDEGDLRRFTTPGRVARVYYGNYEARGDVHDEPFSRVVDVWASGPEEQVVKFARETMSALEASGMRVVIDPDDVERMSASRRVAS